MTELTIPLAPLAWARPRISRWGGIYTDPKREAWRNQVVSYIRHWWGSTQPLVGPVRLTVTFHMPRPKSWPKTKDWPKGRRSLAHYGRPDLDNLVKQLLDCLQCKKGEQWSAPLSDDAQIAFVNAGKVYCFPGEDAHVYLKLEEAIW